MAPRFIAKQLSDPKGWFGPVIGYLMNRHNAKMNAFAIRLLEPGPSDQVLEIGFGGGLTLPKLIESGAFVTGVDRSALMVERASEKFAAAVAHSRAVFLEGSVEALPIKAESVNKVCTVNTVYFWTSLDAGFAEIRRVLSPGGRVLVGFLPKDRMDKLGMPEDIFTTRSQQDVIAALTKVGFDSVRAEKPTPDTAWTVVVADRP